MNRKLLTALSVASVAGTGGVAYATVVAPSAGPSAGPTSTSPTTPPSTTADVAGTAATTYQVGDAGSVTLALTDGSMSTRSIEPAAGWAVASMSNSATHAVVVFQNAERMVGLTADLVSGQVVVAVTNDRLPGVTGIEPTEPLVVTVVEGATSTNSATVPTASVIPATPPSGNADVPTPTSPATSHTTAPSGSDASHSDDDHHGDDHSDDHSGDHSDGDHSDGHHDGGDDD